MHISLRSKAVEALSKAVKGEQVLKHNPYHDEKGRFSDGNGAKFVSTSGVFAERRAAGASGRSGKGYTPAEVEADLAALAEKGVATTPGFAEAFNTAYPSVKPSELMASLSGPGTIASGRMSFRQDGKLAVRAKVSLEKGSYEIHRKIDPETKTVKHELLELSSEAQGAGVVKQIFRDAIPMYEKMGLETVEAFANIDRGGYAWARYGFDQAGTNFRDAAKGRVDSMTKSMANGLARVGKSLGPKALAEAAALKEVLASAVGESPDLPRVFTSLKTPALDKEMAESRAGYGKTFISSMMTHTSWNARLDLKNKAQMAHLNDYIKA